MNYFQEQPVYQWRRGQTSVETFTLPPEEEFCIYVNGQLLVRLMASPTQRQALVVGFLSYSGLIAAADEIEMLHFPETGHCADVWLKGAVTLETPDPLLTSGCGQGVVLGKLYRPAAPLADSLRLEPEHLIEMSQAMQAAAKLRPQSHGVHVSSLFAPDGRLVALAEDIGRHNTLDKLLGTCLLEKQPLEELILITTGRVSSEMISKAARMHAPIVASVNGLTSIAARLATEWGMTAVGYLRGTQMTIYTHPERLGLAP